MPTVCPSGATNFQSTLSRHENFIASHPDLACHWSHVTRHLLLRKPILKIYHHPLVHAVVHKAINLRCDVREGLIEYASAARTHTKKRFIVSRL